MPHQLLNQRPDSVSLPGGERRFCGPLTFTLRQQLRVPLARDFEMDGWMQHVDAPSLICISCPKTPATRVYSRKGACAAYARPDRTAATGGHHAMERPLDPARLGDHLDRLYRAAWALCGSREDAEDLVQETYARVLARPRILRHEDDFVEERSSTRPEHHLEAKEVYEAVSALPGEFRDVVAAVDLAGLSYAEAAGALRIPLGTVMSRL